MAKVYVLTIHYPYEFTAVLGVYSSKEFAEASQVKAKKNDNSLGYNEIEVEGFTVDD